jgi:hypothetical protein
MSAGRLRPAPEIGNAGGPAEGPTASTEDT